MDSSVLIYVFFGFENDIVDSVVVFDVDKVDYWVIKYELRSRVKRIGKVSWKERIRRLLFYSLITSFVGSLEGITVKIELISSQ